LNLIKAKCNRLHCDNLARYGYFTGDGYITDAVCEKSLPELEYLGYDRMTIKPFAYAIESDVVNYNRELENL
jgi:hypothetical protein